MMSRFRQLPDSWRMVLSHTPLQWTHGVYVLLLLAVFLKGLKDPFSFFIWGLVSLIFCLGCLYSAHYSARHLAEAYCIESLLFICILYSQWYSVDPSISLYPTTQAIIFLLIWLALRSSQSLKHGADLMIHMITFLGLITILKTLSQYAGALHDFRHFMDYEWAKTYGYLPTNPTFNAIFMCSIAPVLLPSRHWSSRFVAIGLIAMVFVGPSRSSLIALSCGLLYLFWPRFTFRWIVASLIGLTILAGVIPSRLWEGRLRLNEGNYRSSIWKISALAAKERLLTGYGFGNFELAYQKYAFPVETDTIRYARTTSFAHNEYLQVASDVGLPAFLFFMMLVGRCLLASVPERLRSFKAGLIALCAAAVSSPIWHVPLLAFWTLILCAVVHPPAVKARPALRSWGWRFSLVSVLIASACALGWSAFCSHQAEIQRWDSILRWDFKDATAWHQYAYQTPDAKTSLMAFSQAASLVPENPYFQEAYARALEQSSAARDPVPALSHYLLALEDAPHRAINVLAIGRLLYRSGDYPAALDRFKEARRIEPHFWECDLWIARCWKKLGDRRRAAWGLHNLQRRKTFYETERVRMKKDLPTSNDRSDYEQTILAYDSSVVDRELSAP